MKSAIFYLLRKSDKDYADLRKNIELVRKISHFDNTPILILSEEDVPHFEGTTFHKIKFEIPPWVDQSNMMTKFGEKHTVGYLHMCRFYAGMMFREECLQGYDILIRLDTDGFLSQMKEDLPKYMYDNCIGYMYSGYFEDSPLFTVDLDKHTLDFCNQINAKSYWLNNWSRRSFNTNFEIINVPVLMKTRYMEMFDFFDKTGGFYKYRWGDCPFRYLAMNTIYIEHELMTGIEYSHQQFRRKMND